MPSQEEIDAELEASLDNLTTVCVSHILVATEDEAQDAFDRVTTGGEEFGAVAVEVSTDPGSAENDGVLPCSPAGQYVDEFKDASLIAPIGEVYDELVQTQFGFHVMLVTDRQDPAEEDLPTEESISESLHATNVRDAVNTWFYDAVASADVTVEEEYGTWSHDPPQPGVIPPTP
jgi:peptidyl-prolyl cis-trans isomerase C